MENVQCVISEFCSLMFIETWVVFVLRKGAISINTHNVGIVDAPALDDFTNGFVVKGH